MGAIGGLAQREEEEEALPLLKLANGISRRALSMRGAQDARAPLMRRSHTHTRTIQSSHLESAALFFDRLSRLTEPPNDESQKLHERPSRAGQDIGVAGRFRQPESRAQAERFAWLFIDRESRETLACLSASVCCECPTRLTPSPKAATTSQARALLAALQCVSVFVCVCAFEDSQTIKSLGALARRGRYTHRQQHPNKTSPASLYLQFGSVAAAAAASSVRTNKLAEI